MFCFQPLPKSKNDAMVAADARLVAHASSRAGDDRAGNPARQG